MFSFLLCIMNNERYLLQCHKWQLYNCHFIAFCPTLILFDLIIAPEKSFWKRKIHTCTPLHIILYRAFFKMFLSPVRASEGDAYPVGALPMGSIVCCVEKFPGEGAHYARSAGNSVTLIRPLSDRIVIQLPSKHEVAIDKHCMAVVGKINWGYLKGLEMALH